MFDEEKDDNEKNEESEVKTEVLKDLLETWMSISYYLVKIICLINVLILTRVIIFLIFFGRGNLSRDFGTNEKNK